jgi:hypothetical protein
VPASDETFGFCNETEKSPAGFFMSDGSQDTIAAQSSARSNITVIFFILI